MVYMHALPISQSGLCAYFLARRSPRGGIHDPRLGLRAFWSKRSVFNQISVCTITTEEHFDTYPRTEEEDGKPFDSNLTRYGSL